MLAKNPGFTVVMVLVLALGISVSTTIFRFVDWRLHPSCPFAEPERIVHLSAASETDREEELSYLDFLALREQLPSLAQLATVSYADTLLQKDQWSWEYRTAEVSRDYFSVGRVKAHVGNVFSERDAVALNDPTGVVLSHRLWKSQFGSDPALIGRPILLDNVSRTVLGIAPPGFHVVSTTEGGPVVDIWIPVDMQDDDTIEEMVGHLKPGASLHALRMEIESAFQRLSLNNPDTQAPLKSIVLSDREYRSIPGRPAPAVFLMGLGYIVLLIACLNVSGSLLAKADDRRREMAVRRALGGSRRRLMRQWLTEGALLALLALAVSLLVSYWFMRLVHARSAAEMSPVASLTLRAVIFSLAITCVGTLLFEWLPIWHTCRANLIPLIQEGRNPASHRSRGRRGFSTLVVFQLAMAQILTVGAGLLLRSFLCAATADLGVQKKPVLLAQLQPGGTMTQKQAFFADVVTHVRTLSGARTVGLGLWGPLDTSWGGWEYHVSLSDDSRPGEDHGQVVQANIVTPAYFPAAGIALVKGRDFPEETGPSNSREVIINEAFASRFWPDTDPIGRFIQLRDLGRDRSPTETAQVVGVVRDIRDLRTPETPAPYLYVPLGQAPATRMTLLVETAGDPHLLADAVRDMIQQLDSGIPVHPMTTLSEEIEQRTSGHATDAKLIGTLSLIGMALASIGLYGIVAFTARRRTRELGIRMALGARSRDILRMVMGQGLRLSLIGLGLGLIGSSILSHILRALLLGFGPLDPLTFAGSFLVVMGTALLASYVPARRAARIDPMAALRYE
jgi:predicted permease